MSFRCRPSLPRLSIPSLTDATGHLNRDRIAYCPYRDLPCSAAERLTALEGLPLLAVPQVHYELDCDLANAHLAHDPPAFYTSPRSPHNEMPKQRFLTPIPLPSVPSYPTEDASQTADDNDDEQTSPYRCEDLLPGAHTMFHEHLRTMCPLSESDSPLSPQQSSFVAPPAADLPTSGLLFAGVVPSPPTPVLRPTHALLLPPVPLDLSPLPGPAHLSRHEHVELEYASAFNVGSAASIPRSVGTTGHAYPSQSTRITRAPSNGVVSGRAPAVPRFAQPARRERGIPLGTTR
ncbi:hypothetical protein C8Q70DRAFT_1049951 [Cubamyces menziesii]|uniref:Uncharacterized protein n=1 Tax=Trametes cubensis TaxID=1111947 RepID=A0AAD7U2B8_9APHY|nr:hypothetical protein C8Q70DRAFT_1049951 [Cubamyces menziesii]KAJ8496070.1 hypothetical protein ONZ51_g1351 [Trametes cubensis]